MTNSVKSCLHELIDSADNILLLQGPVGYFFHLLGVWLTEEHGKVVHKINFNAGDEYFYPERTPNTSAYSDALENFQAHLEDYITLHNIQAVVCFGDTRPYHLFAKPIAERSCCTFWVFEEGYFRPFFITLEKSGVNAYSLLPRDSVFFLNNYPRLIQKKYQEPLPVPTGFLPIAKSAAIYYLQANLSKNKSKYPYYIHHRHLNLGHYAQLWTRSIFKRIQYWLKDFVVVKQIEDGKYGKFFIVPLQVFNDSQVRIHCDFSSVRSFLLHVLTSFSAHAPSDVNLIIKHHPMDRGFINYADDINVFIKKHPHLKGRIFYVHDVPLPVFLRHGVGMVTINSTSGLSALIHNMPVKVLGRAHYDIPNITDQGSLANFWHCPTPPDSALFHAYRMYHINITQINGSFYSKTNFPAISKKSHLNLK